MGWTAEEISADYGEDLACEPFINNQRTNLGFRCQVKTTATGRGTARETANGYSVRISRSLIAHWAGSYVPVLLLVADVRQGRVYWTEATSIARDLVSRPTTPLTTVRVSKDNLLDFSAHEHILAALQKFYASLLRLTKPSLKCTIYPALMPTYRCAPMRPLLDIAAQLGGKRGPCNSTIRDTGHRPAAVVYDTSIARITYAGTIIHSLIGEPVTQGVFGDSPRAT